MISAQALRTGELQLHRHDAPFAADDGAGSATGSRCRGILHNDHGMTSEPRHFRKCAHIVTQPEHVDVLDELVGKARIASLMQQLETADEQILVLAQ